MGIELDELTLDVKKGLFKLEQITTYPYEKEDNVWISVTIERNLNLTEFERTIYTGFDFLSDVGGLSGILMSFLAIIVGIWNFNSFENVMASHLFKFRHRGEETDPGLPLKPSQMLNLYDFILNCTPQKCHCCKKSTKNEAF